MRLLVLYEELAPYFLENIKRFAEHFKVPVLIVAKSVNPVAPFQFQTNSNFVQIINREDYSFEDLLNEIKAFQPTCLMQAGWIYKAYFEITKQLQLKRTILLMDNQWENTLRQNIGSIYFRIKYKSLFHKALVPGTKQKIFAQHLGFKEEDIELGFYCCDTPLFEQVYIERQKQKKRYYTFLFIGRYAPEKNITMLWEAFAEVCKENSHSWKLLCVGKGNIQPFQHPQIKHLGFIQPQELPDILLKTDVFVLPSIFEPWGVVVHEMTTAGLPVISSAKVGANEFFVHHKKNGFVFSPTNKQELKKYILQVIQMSDADYFEMCKLSYQFSQQINSEKWIQKIYHLCNV